MTSLESAIEHVYAWLSPGFDESRVGMALVSLDERFMRVNDALCRTLGRPSEELIDRTWEEVTHPEDQAQAGAVAKPISEPTAFVSTERRCVRKDGANVWVLIVGSLVSDPEAGPTCFLTHVYDISEKKAGEAALAHHAATVELLKRVAVAANEADSINEALRGVLADVCSYTAWPVGHALVTRTGDTPSLHSTGVWHLRGTGDLEPFKTVTEQMRWTPGVGLPGRVLASGRPEWIEDYFAASQFPRSEDAGDFGIRSAFAFPVVCGSEVAAVLEFFSFKSESIDKDVLEMMANVGSALGRVFERTRARDAVTASEERARLIIDTAIDPYIEIDQEGLVTSWNGQAESSFGWKRDEVLGRRLSDTIIPPEAATLHERGLRRFLDTGEGSVLRRPVHVEALHRSGRRLPVELTVWPVRTGEGWTFNAFVRDISERVHMEEELRRLSTVDELTGLKNRREFMNLALRELGLADRLEHRSTLLFIDLDELKQINDRFGHQEGDRAIIDVADLLVRTFRDVDLIARVGGDEFCVLQPATDKAQAQISVARLQSVINEFNDSGKRPYRLSISIGSSTFGPDAPVTIHTLMDRADQAMYEHKSRRLERPRLLVVDDDGGMRRLAHRIFGDDYEVVAVPTGEKALASALANRPDAVVVDLGLPDISGREVVERLRDSDECASVPILVLTGAGDSAAEIESLRAGVDDFVGKPFNTDVLRLRVDNLLRRPARR